MDVLLRHGEHAAGAAGRVIDGRGAAAGGGRAVRGEDEVHHELDDLARGVVLPGVLVVGFGKAADELLKDIAHLQIGDLVRMEVGLAGGEFLEHHIEDVLFRHRGEVRPERLELFQYLPDVGRKGVAVGAEVGRQTGGGGQQAFKGEGAGIVELEAAGGGAQLCGQQGRALVLPERGQHGGLGGLQYAVETADDGQGEDDLAILMRLERAGQLVGNGPDEIGFFGNGGGKGHGTSSAKGDGRRGRLRRAPAAHAAHGTTATRATRTANGADRAKNDTPPYGKSISAGRQAGKAGA